MIHHALDRGVNFLDSSDMYGWGHNETLLGRALKGRRDKAIVCHQVRPGEEPAGGGNGVDGRPEYVIQACEASLKRLGVDVIDLYYQHRVDPEVPIEDTVGAMKRLVEQGKVRALGLCEATPETIRRATRCIRSPRCRPSTRCSTARRRRRRSRRRASSASRFVAYSPLGRSLLTGSGAGPRPTSPKATAARHPRFQGENLDEEPRAGRRLESDRDARRTARRASSRSPGCSRRARTSCRSPAPSARDSTRTRRARREAERDDVKRLAEAMPAGAAAGTRYPEAR